MFLNISHTILWHFKAYPCLCVASPDFVLSLHFQAVTIRHPSITIQEAGKSVISRDKSLEKI